MIRKETSRLPDCNRGTVEVEIVVVGVAGGDVACVVEEGVDIADAEEGTAVVVVVACYVVVAVVAVVVVVVGG